MIRAVVISRALGLVVAAVTGMGLSSCRSTDGYPARRAYVPRVAMPGDLNRDEEEYLPEVAEALRRAGFQPTRDREAEYQLSLSIEDGPVNADTRMRLQSGRREVARAYARVGGPRIVFQRRRVIRESFEKALRDFEAQLPRYGGGRSDWESENEGDDRYEDDRWSGRNNRYD